MNRIVMITGATRGIGLATAAQFLKYGDSVAIFCRHRSHAAKARELLSSAGPHSNILALTGDVRRGPDADRLVKQCLGHFGRIDVLINNAGIASYKPVEETSEREWDSIIDTNLKGAFLFIRRVLPVMKKQRKGTIINIASALGVAAEANFSAYCASKFGVVGLTGAVADEVRNSGIRVYAVLPWAVNTTLLKGSDLELDPADVLDPGYVARRIFEAARGGRKNGSLIEVYS